MFWPLTFDLCHREGADQTWQAQVGSGTHLLFEWSIDGEHITISPDSQVRLCLFVYLFICLFVHCCFISQENLSSYHNGRPLVTVCSHGNFIVWPHWEATDMLTWWYLTQSYYFDATLTSCCPILLMVSTRVGSDKCQFVKLLVWLGWCWYLNSQPSTFETGPWPVSGKKTIVIIL